ncbi:MAG: ABC transporter substrate-binding protein [Oscillospiraceae bacterium]|nr:ABC transporter substrate-binding protein [Oscillospiraceae bacterium]
MLRKNKFISLALTAVLALTFVLSGCGTREDMPQEQPQDITGPQEELQGVTLLLDWTPNTNHTGIYAAQELGYLREEGISLEIVQPPEDGTLALVAAGSADFGISHQEDVLIAANADTPLPVTAIASLVQHNTSGILSLKEAGISRFKDLEGKRCVTWNIPVYDEIIKECVRNDGGDPAKIEFVPSSAMDNISGLKNKEYDAVWVFEGWDRVIADHSGLETNFFAFRDINPVFDYYTPVLVTNTENLEKDFVKKFLGAVAKGYEYAKLNPQEAADILSKFAPEADKEIISASQEFLSQEYYDLEWGKIAPVRWNAFFEWMKEKDIIRTDASNSALE